jgi:hypothetical protein
MAAEGDTDSSSMSYFFSQKNKMVDALKIVEISPF